MGIIWRSITAVITAKESVGAAVLQSPQHGYWLAQWHCSHRTTSITRCSGTVITAARPSVGAASLQSSQHRYRWLQRQCGHRSTAIGWCSHRSESIGGRSETVVIAAKVSVGTAALQSPQNGYRYDKRKPPLPIINSLRP